ncbi:complement C1q-like protein 4 [Centropristis striata]|uniref:complement C1q-like protein 4 n=1 Tax=Centropristis striata TaxID=184440 RepID=UPI0027E141DE|nr:complement C1q-like protein 4 [Centropristis striata]
MKACQSGMGSCRCCLMAQEVKRLQTYFSTTLDEIEEENNKTIAVIDKVKDSRTAFSVALRDTFGCYGAFDKERVIVYKHVFINLGGSYSDETGIFTVPHSGVYSLALTVYSDAGSPGSLLSACANLEVNGQVVAGPRENNEQDQEDSATINLALHLKAGDKVTVNLPPGCFLCDDSSHYNTFSGFLLYLEEVYNA